MTTIEIVTLSLSSLSIIITIYFGFQTIQLRMKVLRTTQLTYEQNQLSKFNSSLNSLIDIAQEYHILQITPESQRDLLYDRKLGNLKLARASLVESTDNLAKEVEQMITATNFSELAKSLYSVYEYEKAEKYHLKAIQKSSGSLGISCRRSYADFLFCINKPAKGREEYKLCIVDEDTDSNKELNVRTLIMLMYNEAQLNNNSRETQKVYEDAISLASRISLPNRKRDLILEIENLRKQFLENK